MATTQADIQTLVADVQAEIETAITRYTSLAERLNAVDADTDRPAGQLATLLQDLLAAVAEDDDAWSALEQRTQSAAADRLFPTAG